MVKHTTKEAYFERLKNLAEVNKISLKESQVRNLGSLIDYKRASDGVAYGIIKENHSYYLKKAGIKQDPNVSDFVYIGGLGNITNFKYKSLGEADKQRNMIFHTINEATSLRPDKNGSKKKLNEDIASDEIDKAAKKVGDLDNATNAEADPELDTNGNAEMSAGLDAKDPTLTPAEEPSPEGELPAPEGGEESMPPEGGGEEMPPEGDTGSAELPPEGDAGDEELPPEGDETGAESPEGDGTENPEGASNGEEPNSDIEKAVGKISNKIRKTDMEDTQVKSLVGSFLSSFKDKFRDIDIEDRKEMANKILKVVGQEEIDDLGDNVEQSDTEAGPESLPEDKQPCAECGGFGSYAESRGYGSPESFMECDDEEKANVISGYANAHGEGQNDGDFKTIAIVITPEILEKLKSDYGHEDFANELTPYSNEMNETSEEDKMAQLREGWSGIKNALGKVGGDIGGGLKKGAEAVGRGVSNAAGAVGRGVGGAASAVGNAVKTGAQAVGNTVGKGAQAVGKYAGDVQKSYHQGEVDPEIAKLEKFANNLGQQITALNSRLKKAGKDPVNVQDILGQITGQMGNAAVPANIQNNQGASDAWKLGKNAKTQVGKVSGLKVAENTDPAYTTVQPSAMIQEDDETDEPEEDKTKDKLDGEEFGDDETGTEEFGGEEEFDTPEVSGAMGGSLPIIGGTQNLGLNSTKPDGTGVEITVEPDKTININMNEAKKQLIKSIAEDVNKYMAQAKPSVGKKNKMYSKSAPEPEPAVNEVKKKGLIVDKINKSTGIVNKTGKLNSKNVAKQGKYMAKPIGQTKKFTKPTEVVNESEQKLRKYVHMRLEEKAGLRKSNLNESTKSPVLKKLDSVIDEQFKLYEKVILKKKDNINESTVNEIFGLEKIGQKIKQTFVPMEGIIARFQELDPEDVKGIETLLSDAYPILHNPGFGAQMAIARKNTSIPEKYDLISLYVDNKGGTLRVANPGPQGKLVYAEQGIKNKATGSDFGSGGTMGKTAMGGV